MRFAAMVLGLLGLTAFGEVSSPTRLDVTTQPAGASVIIDGRDRGLSPLTLFDLKPGRYHVKYRLNGYGDRDGFFTLEQNRPLQQSAVLEPVKGVLLLQTEPEGCNITVDGMSIGTTPRLVTTLDVKDTHRVVLEKAGYRPAEFTVRFNGRKPVVRKETMLLDSGVLVITTEPEQAEVTVNGIVRGKTPITVTDIPKGRATVQLKLDGFDEETRELTVNSGDRQTLAVSLKGKPGTLYLSSVPEGARFYLNNEFRGISPVTIPGLRPGSYEVRAEKDGYGTSTRTVTVGNGASLREEFRLSNMMGRLEIRTIPVGAIVTVDGRNLGATKASDPNATASDPLSVENLMQGEHVLVVKADGYATVTKHPYVENSKTAQANVKLKRYFKPNVRVITGSGEVMGVLIKNDADLVTLEVKLGVEKSFRRGDIRKIEFLEDQSR